MMDAMLAFLWYHPYGLLAILVVVAALQWTIIVTSLVRLYRRSR